jgi:hypothetical protein
MINSPFKKGKKYSAHKIPAGLFIHLTRYRPVKVQHVNISVADPKPFIPDPARTFQRVSDMLRVHQHILKFKIMVIITAIVEICAHPILFLVPFCPSL